MTGWINTRFGTARGLIRLALSYPQHWLGQATLSHSTRRVGTSAFKIMKLLVLETAGKTHR